MPLPNAADHLHLPNSSTIKKRPTVNSFFRKMRIPTFLAFAWTLSCTSIKATTGEMQAKQQVLAFPTAEGAGKYATGGRGGKVIKVTNLNDAGAGSLRAAIEEKGPRTILFETDGTIELQSKLLILNDSITIAGQSAPGDGICIKGFPLYIYANNVVIRYIRTRMGDIHPFEDDAFGGRKIKNAILDHCSSSWSIDECLSFYQNEYVTVQWCMITQSLSKSYHHKGAHGFGGIWGGRNVSFHHNLIADHSSRNPRFGSDGYAPVDFRNNVVFNWGYKAAYGGGRNGRINFVANYYKPGPATTPAKRSCFLDASEDGTGQYYLDGNTMVDNDSVTGNNWLGVQSNVKPEIHATAPFPFTPIRQDSPEKAYRKVLQAAGCSFRRDTYDARIIREVRTGKAKGGKTFGGGDKGIIDSQEEVGGWPILKAGKARPDSDGDGIPDTWEKHHHLDPANAENASAHHLDRDYTDLEIYLNSIKP
jgi:hypothetical protein